MANNIVLKTYKGGTVTPQNDAIIQETAIPSNGIFKGCNVSYARGNILRVSQGFGMIKGRLFEVYESEIGVELAEGSSTLYGRIYVHMDLSNADEPVTILTETGTTLSELEMDSDVNYNNSVYDMELATFRVSSTDISKLEQTFQKITAGSGGGGGGQESIARQTSYHIGDVSRHASAPGWAFFVCIQAGETASAVPTGYGQVEKSGDSVTDGTAVFEARDLVGELDTLKENGTKMQDDITQIMGKLSSAEGITTVLCSLEEYAAMEGWSDTTVYLCYYAANPGRIVRIYMGENKIFSEGTKVTFFVDTDNQVTKQVDDHADALLSAPKAELDGYEFVGWRADTEAEKTVLQTCIIETEEALNLYAVFKRSIEIGMHPNSGVLLDGKTESTIQTDCYYNQGKAKSDAVTIPECPYEKENMSFIGWMCNGTFYKPDEKGTFSDDGTLLASWIDTVYDFPYTGTYQVFNVPADGIYELEVWGAEGGTATYNATTTTKGGKGGHAKGYKELKKGEVIYVFNGGKPAGTSGGANAGIYGTNYTNSKLYGAGGGGATHIAYLSGTIGATGTSGLNYTNRDKFLIIAGGGGGGAMKLDTSYAIVESHEGGDGGGERGGDGSGGALGGRQISVGSSDSFHFGTYTVSYSSSSCNSGGGSGWFAGAYGTGGQSGAGGSGYVGGVAGFTHKKKYYGNLNEAGINEGDGKSFIRYVTVA